MVTEPITLQIEVDAARAFRTASPDEQEKLQLLMSVLMKEYAKTNPPSLKQSMDEIGERAREKGLTSELLDSILRDD
ncbi:MAG: hypothetical protein QOH71_2842 [Blastocatellia bacterium]|jgi:hypothetical protein|nr:hypothetical protein [Blastocatellia bacterium]